MTLSHGRFITFEGIDGSGKTTQIELCADALRREGFEVVVTRNPGGTEFGRQLREILLHSTTPVFPTSELLLFIADRAQHMDEVVFPALQAKKIILCDRHIDSTVAYQGYGRGLPLERIHELNHIAIQGRKPDLTFLCDGDPTVLAQRVNSRGKADRMEGEALHFHEKVREGYLTLARQEPERIQVIDATRPPKDIHQAVMAKLEQALQKV